MQHRTEWKKERRARAIQPGPGLGARVLLRRQWRKSPPGAPAHTHTHNSQKIPTAQVDLISLWGFFFFLSKQRGKGGGLGGLGGGHVLLCAGFLFSFFFFFFFGWVFFFYFIFCINKL